ncbi:MAG: 23S rRNA (uracil(1939)-C(5))-methyltransferase RlmD [Clostridia bacterium]|nr:23S rRNA (uracil(1939)-C(5))-methyltransferase RlmD [Clostridia bacterium]
MRKGDIIEVTIEEFEYPNTGIGYIDGIKVKVEKALKGQSVRAQIKKKNKQRIIAKIKEVVERADYEIDPLCVHFGECGGCSLQTIPYVQQVIMKGKEVQRLLNENDIFVKEFQGVEGSPSSSCYRNKMEYTFGDESKGGKPALGMHKKGSFMNIVTTNQCHLVHEDFNKIAVSTLEHFNTKGYPFYNKKTHKGLQRNLIIRKGERTGELLINIVTTSQMDFDKESFVEMLLDLSLEGTIVGIVHTINDSVSDFVYCDSLKVLWGRDHYYEESLGLKFKVTAFSFFQTNTSAAEKLYATVLEYLQDIKGKTVFDLYCGTGTIGQIAALKAGKVIGVELVEEAVEAANENAQLNQLDNCTFVAGDVLKELDHIEDKPDVIILDPPRVGVNAKALNKIIDYNVKHMVYVSCNPKSLVENLVALQEAGYVVEKVKVLDNFPHTGHTEVVTLLTK